MTSITKMHGTMNIKYFTYSNCYFANTQYFWLAERDIDDVILAKEFKKGKKTGQLFLKLQCNVRNIHSGEKCFV